MTTPATDQFAALPKPVQDQLLDLARTAAGMSASEKEHARLFFGFIALQSSTDIVDDGVPAALMVGAAGRVVALLDEASGSAGSRMVV